MSEQDRLAQAVELVKAGKHAEAQEIVAEVIRADRNNARAWILMAKIVDDPEKALQCWQQVARLKPDDPRVQEEIARLKGEPATQTQSQERPFNAKSFVSAPKRWDNNPLPDGATSKCNRKTFCCLPKQIVICRQTDRDLFRNASMPGG